MVHNAAHGSDSQNKLHNSSKFIRSKEILHFFLKCLLVKKSVHKPSCSSLYLNEFLAIYYSNWFFKFQQYFCRTDLEKVHQSIKKPCTISRLKSYMHLAMKHMVAYSVTPVLTKNHDIAIKGIFLPSSLQNDGKRGTYLAPNSNCNNWNRAQ